MAVRQRKPTPKLDPIPQPIAQELLARFDGRHEFQVDRKENGISLKPITVTDTLEGVMDRGSKYIEQAAEREYIREKQEWLRQHPTATDSAYEAKCREIAKSLGL